MVGLGGLGELPHDAIVLLVGPSGAGKSTWAAGHTPSGTIVSSDALRALVAGDASDQSASADAFRILHAIVRARARRGLLTVVDATNLTAGARRTLLRLAAAAGRPAVAILFDVSLDTCLERNRSRPDRRVPEAVVRRQHDRLADARRRIGDEGYAAVRMLRDVDLRAD
jgi:predicted kinase